MQNLNIGFLAGCINTQKEIDKDKLFHAVIAKYFATQATDVTFQISLGSYPSYNQVIERTKSFIDKNDLNLLCLFVRPFPLMPLHKLLVKYENSNGGKSFSFHPALFNRELEWKTSLTRYQSNNEFVYVKKAPFGLRDINLLLGSWLGLHKWAYKYVLKQLIAISCYCKSNNVKLIIVSPPNNPESVMGSSICMRVATLLSRHCHISGMPYVNISIIDTYDFYVDKIHFNENGHRVVANLIMEKIIEEGLMNIKRPALAAAL